MPPDSLAQRWPSGRAVAARGERGAGEAAVQRKAFRGLGESVFISAGSALSGGIIFVNRKGQALSVKVNEASFINYVSGLQQLGNRAEIAFTL
ncbi:unnamed protein product, partial [Prorocentrum cordatum]